MSQQSTIGTHKTTVKQSNGILSVVYHSTEVVRFDRSTNMLTLDDGGWATSTTKTRMNQASRQFGLGYRVFQKDYDWFIEVNGEVIPFTSEPIKIA